MNATLKKLEIGFENVEVIKIPAKFILALNMRGVKEFRNSYQNDGKGLAMFRGTSAEKIYLQKNYLDAEDNLIVEIGKDFGK